MDGYALNYVGVAPEDVKRVMRRKDANGDDYKPHRIKVWARGKLMCETQFEGWLDDENLVLVGDCLASGGQELVSHFKVYVTTADETHAGTNNRVLIDIFGTDREFYYQLHRAWHDDFERGNTDEFTVPSPPGVPLAAVTGFKILKDPDGLWFGGWKLAGLSIVAFTNASPSGKLIYANPNINVWLENENLSFEGSITPA